MKLQSVILFLASTFFFYSCEKEYSVENGDIPAGETAVYSFGGGTGNCAGATVSGTVTAGTALTSANTVELQVTVDSIGTYSVSTASVNGISFSGSGTFTSTGVQTIQLTGSGTPTTAGVFNYTAGSAGCTFSVIAEDSGGSSGGTAVYAFDGGTGDCTGAVVDGVYVAGVPLTSANTVTLGVNVTTVGTYNISTASGNGISFSGSGTFASTGVQTIILSGSGTPSAAGVVSLKPGSTGCTFNVIITDLTGGTSDYYYDITVDGVHYKETANVGDYGIFVGNDGFDSVLCRGGIAPLTDPFPAGETSFGISKGTFYNYLSATDAEFKNFFSVGSYPYAPPTWLNGVSVGWSDESGKFWSSDNLPGTQSGSTFTITNVVDDAADFPNYGVKVTIEFSCKIYDDAGISKTITNGKFVGVYSKH